MDKSAGKDQDVGADSSDESEDEDYVPAQDKTCAADSGSDAECDKVKVGTKRKVSIRSSRRKTNLKSASESSDDEDHVQQTETTTSTVKESDWMDFLNSYNKPKVKRHDISKSNDAAATSSTSKTGEQISKKEKIYAFAGETIRIPQSNQNPNSKEAIPPNTNCIAKEKNSFSGKTLHTDSADKITKNSSDNTQQATSASTTGLNIISLPSSADGLQSFLNKRINPSLNPDNTGKPSGGSGISSVLEKISEKGKKLSVLDKSKLDWDTFKCDTGIGEEIKTINKGKACYTDKVAFLERVDWKTFEKEKEIRDHERKKRFHPDTK